MTSPIRSIREPDAMMPSPRQSQSETELELTRLKQKLHDQTTRLQPSLTPRRPDGSATAAGMSGINYTQKPYARVCSRNMWEPFAADKEVVEWSSKIERSEERIKQLANLAEYRHSTARPNAMIMPPEPLVFSAADSEVPALAAAAETFAEAQSNKMMFEGFDAPSPQFQVNVTSFGESSQRLARQHPGGLVPSDSQVYKRRTSSIKVSASTLSILRQLENCVDLHIPAPGEVELNRVGDVLTEHCVVKRDLFESAFIRVDQLGVFSGAPYFRMVPKFNIAGVAQADTIGIRTAINELRRVYPADLGPIIWVCVREEPIIYINGRSHVVRNINLHNKAASIPNINGVRINAIEEKLLTEIEAEAEVNGGNVCIHRETANGAIDALWEAVDTVSTFQKVMEKINASGKDVKCIRQPITQNVGPQPADFQFLYDLCLEHPTAPLVFNCQTGRGRSSMMMLISSIVRFYQHCPKDTKADATLLQGGSASKENSYRSLMKLIALLPDGHIHEKRVAVLMEMSDKIYSIAAHINASFKATDNQQAARMRLVQYANVLLFSCYCSSRLWDMTTTLPFPQWIDSMKEVQVILGNLSTRFQQQEEQIVLVPAVDASDAEAMAIIERRNGNILRGNTILRAAPIEIHDGPMTIIPGVLALRHVGPDIPFFTCGRVSNTGRENLLYNIRLNFPASKRIHWISVRAEPMVFINDTSYSVVENSLNALESSMHIGLERLEKMEEKLKRDVVAEGQRYGGNILVHNPEGRLTGSESLTAQKVQIKSIRMPRLVMEAFATTNDVHYFHVPIPKGGTLIPEDFEPFLRHLHQHYDDNDAFVIADGAGDARTTIVLNILAMFAIAGQTSLRGIKSEAHALQLLQKGNSGKLLSKVRCYENSSLIDDEAEAVFNKAIELQAGSVVGQMLAAGSVNHALKCVMDLCGSGPQWNLLHHIDSVKEAAQAEHGDRRLRLTEAAIDLVQNYLMVFLCAVYMDDNSGYNDMLSFTKWASELEEVQNVLDHLRERPAASLKYVEATNLMASTVTDRAVTRRKGDVLTANYAMKADHFPGCAKKGIRPALCGAPNFRKVELTNVYGVAIPTIRGVHNLLSVLGASTEQLTTYPGEQNDDQMGIAYPCLGVFDPKELPERPWQRGRVIWINLREEPLMYVGDKPYVFRDMAQPYVNVELTGIEGSKVEMLEVKLKHDILTEGQEYDGNFLVHDEGKPGELVGTWETATNETVRTVREVYDDAVMETGCRVKFHRMPVTDEQSPELKDFDMLIRTLLPEILDAAKHTDMSLSFVFNCQMGRGRTTTGMVVCCLLIGAVHPEYFEGLQKVHTTLFKPNDSELSQGNYRCVQQLKTVMPTGRRSKLRLDLVLEACSKMQNLRTAIENFVNIIQSTDVREDERGRAHHHGIHYLHRYFNLIAFTEYLATELDTVKGVARTSFEDWMNARPELVSIREAAELV